MKSVPSLVATSVFALAAGFSGLATAAKNIELVFSGVPAANASTPPSIPAFANWCGGICFPTTQFPVYDPATGKKQGHAHVWGKSFAFGAGGSLCFSEFIALSLDEGEIYVNSPTNGTCGAQIDPALKPPLHADLGALVVIGGGGDGVIAGGRGRFKRATGTYTDRVFVGFGAPTSGVGGIIYYDQLWISVSPNGSGDD